VRVIHKIINSKLIKLWPAKPLLEMLGDHGRE